MDGGRKLSEVAKQAGVSPRTVRYYIQRGLLPAPRFRGADTAYDDEHLERLVAIRRLQEAYWPLDAIARLFSASPRAAIAAIAAGGALPALAPDPPSAPRSTEPEALEARLVRRVALDGALVLEVPEPLPPSSRALLEAILALRGAPYRS